MTRNEISKPGTGASGVEFKRTENPHAEAIVSARGDRVGNFLWGPNLGGKLLLDLYVPVTSTVRLELPALEDIVAEGQRIREALNPQEEPKE